MARTDPRARTGERIDELTPEGLEEQLEDGTTGPEVRAMHVADAVTEVLDDERDVGDADLLGDAGGELEWRIATSADRDELRLPEEPDER